LVEVLKPDGLRFGPLDNRAVHVCVDMQRLFAEDTPWRTPWMRRVLPNVVALAAAQPERLCFTRFVPLAEPGEGTGTWRRYYERWSDVTLRTIDPALVDLVPELQRFSPPAPLFDKHVYSPWWSTPLHETLRRAEVSTVIVSGGETEVCVLATILGAIDLGYRVVVATDALCSSADETHDAMLAIYHSRYGMQVETAACEEILDAWR
jgi:nicotinamidase-related amidase